MKSLLYVILFFAFLVRLVGVPYGLPLWVVADEPAGILGALKMIELKTVVPALHQEAFASVLYYPPYVSYFYLAPFAVLLGMNYIGFSGDSGQFASYIVSDLSQFFMLARLLSVLMGVASIGLVYSIAKRLFADTRAALAAAFFLVTSMLHIALTATARHWVLASFLFTLGLWVLTDTRRSLWRRYVMVALIAGIGMGVNSVVALLLLFAAGWYVFVEKGNFAAPFKRGAFYAGMLTFLLLAVLPNMLYSASWSFFAQESDAGNSITLFGFLKAPFLFYAPLGISEPVLMALSFVGLLFLWRLRRSLFWALLLFCVVYAEVFYIAYQYQPRFIILVLPLIALAAGYGAIMLYRSLPRTVGAVVLAMLLLLPTLTALRLAYLMQQNDSRAAARQWMETHVPAGSRALVAADLMRLSTTPDAVEEQRKIAPSSLRRADVAEAVFEENPHGYPSFHALDVLRLPDEFDAGIEAYAKAGGYRYLVFADDKGAGHQEALNALALHGTIVQSFGSSQSRYSLTASQFFGTPWGLWTLKQFGPRVTIYELAL